MADVNAATREALAQQARDREAREMNRLARLDAARQARLAREQAAFGSVRNGRSD